MVKRRNVNTITKWLQFSATLKRDLLIIFFDVQVSANFRALTLKYHACKSINFNQNMKKRKKKLKEETFRKNLC